MHYRISIHRTAELSLKSQFAFDGYDPEGAYPYAMFVYLIRAPGRQPILVDTGPRSIDEINRGITGLVLEPVTQRPGESIESILRREEVDAAEISHVFFTHLHYDHVSNVHLFPNARIVVSEAGWEDALARGGGAAPGEVFFPMRDEWSSRVIPAADGQEVLPGIVTLHFGGHTRCSMGIAVETIKGRAIITGDVVSLYANVEMDIPIGVYEDREQVMAAMARIRRESDIIIPSHDPLVLERWPNGIG